MEVKKAIEKLSPLLRNKKLIPFCGSEISEGSGIPLISDFFKRLGYSRLSQKLDRTGIETHFPNFQVEFINTFDPEDIQPGKIHRLIANLNTKYCITTNYDKLLEKAFREYFKDGLQKRLHVVMKESDLIRSADGRKVLIKIHGDVETQDLLALTLSDYRKRWKNPTIVDGLVSYLFATSPILFLGYTFSDEHILGFLEDENLLKNRHLPERYIVLPSYEEETYSSLLARLRITPIFLDCKSADEKDEALADFLRRLWEQTHEFADFTKMLEVEFESPEKMLMRAMVNRQELDFEGAKRLHDRLLDENKIQWNNYVNLLPGFVWLSISLYDKMELWEELENKILPFFNRIFKTLKGQVPNFIYEAIECNFYGHYALAKLRSGNFNVAEESILKALKWEITDSAHRELQIMFANLHVVRAIINISRVQLYGLNSSKLIEAEEEMEVARIRYGKYGKEGSKDESHHLGRYYGTLAYLLIAKFNKGLDNYLNADKLQKYSFKAHTSKLYVNQDHNTKIVKEKNRTQYGRLAGLYCDALSHFILAEAEKNDLFQENYYLKIAFTRIRESISLREANQFLTRFRQYSLAVKILERLLGHFQNSNESIASDLQSFLSIELNHFINLIKVGKLDFLHQELLIPEQSNLIPEQLFLFFSDELERSRNNLKDAQLQFLDEIKSVDAWLRTPMN